jgi:hypothetical protein
MPTFSSIQLGPTGRSVARSYANTISKLVSARKCYAKFISIIFSARTPFLETNIGADPVKDMSDDQRRYKNAMTFLTQEQPGKGGLTLIELYTAKQSKYTQVVAEKNAAFNKALSDSNEATKNEPMPKDKAKEHYDRWVQEHARTWRNYVQAAYMDWVVTGKKEEVEYWFSVVDQDSALSRVEQSKASYVHEFLTSLYLTSFGLFPGNHALGRRPGHRRFMRISEGETRAYRLVRSVKYPTIANSHDHDHIGRTFARPR